MDGSRYFDDWGVGGMVSRVMTCDDGRGEDIYCEVGVELSCVGMRDSDWCSICGKWLGRRRSRFDSALG